MACLPATFATAYFIAVILMDLYTRDWRRVPGHALFGVFAVLLLGFICEKGSEGMAWILLLAPLIFLILGYFVRLLTAVDWKNYFIRSVSDAEQNARESYSKSECDAEPCECGKPCPPPTPEQPRPSCPPCPRCQGGSPPPPPQPKPGSCIKGTLTD